jgi:hypothetical protein
MAHYLYKQAVGSSVSAVSAVRQHCVNANRYNTQHTSYTPCVSLKRTANSKLNAAQCFWRIQQLHSQSANMEQEGSLPCAQKLVYFFNPEQNKPNHIPPCLDLFNIYFNIILPSTPTSLKWFPSPHAVLPRYTNCISNVFHVANSCLRKQNAKQCSVIFVLQYKQW